MSDELELELDWGNRKPRGQEGSSIEPAPNSRTGAPPPERRLPPGHPDAMPEGLRFRIGRFFTDGTLRIKQAMELAQALVGWDQANAYDVLDETGAVLFCAQEQSNGLLSSLSRNFNPLMPGSRWPTEAGIYEPLAIRNAAAGTWVPWLATAWPPNGTSTVGDELFEGRCAYWRTAYVRGMVRGYLERTIMDEERVGVNSTLYAMPTQLG